MFRSLRFPARLGQAVAENARCQQSSFLEMVRRRQTQRLLQLRGPPPREAQEQSGLDLRSGTGDGVSRRHHLPGTVQARKRSCRDASRFRRTENRRPRHHSHADGSGVAHHHAGLRAAWRRPLRGFRRIQRRSVRPARRRLRQPRAHLRGRLQPQWQVGRSQSQRGHRRENRDERGPRDRKGFSVEAPSRKIFF